MADRIRAGRARVRDDGYGTAESKSIGEIQARFELPFLLENIVHLLPDYPGDYADAAFLNELVTRTGCGLLLDVYNLECDAANYGFDIDAFLDELDLEAVGELHVAGGVERDGMQVDVHSRLTEPSTPNSNRNTELVLLSTK